MSRRGRGRPTIGKRPMTNAERQRRHRLLMTQRDQQELNNMNEALLKVPPPLPSTRHDLLAQYKLKRRRTINDLVEEIVVKLWDNDEHFMKYIEPIYDSQAEEGSIEENHTMASLIVRDTAKKEKNVQVGDQNLHTIKLAMRVVLRRFGISVPERLELATPPIVTPAPQPEPQPTAAE